jgi:hypothetical protein
VPGITDAQVKICDRVNWGNCAGATADTYLNVPTGMGAINLVEVRVTGYVFEMMGLPFIPDIPSMTFTDIQAIMRQIV